jgi:hypothetical protein
LESGDHCGAASWDDGALMNAGLGEVELSQRAHLAEAIREGVSDVCGVQFETFERRKLHQT